MMNDHGVAARSIRALRGPNLYASMPVLFPAAAAMPETMLVSGTNHASDEVSGLEMALGPGVVQGVVIDSHFAERGRMGGLIGAVTQSPRVLGIGIDEDTAIIVEPEHCFRVIGSGAVYVVDGRAIKYSSLSEQNAESILNVHGVKIHVMGSSASFDLMTRTPTAPQCTDQN